MHSTMKTKGDNIKTLDDLRRRKAELRRQIDTDRSEIINTLNDIKHELNPADLLKSALGGLFDNSTESKNLMKKGVSSGAVAFANNFVGSPRTAFVVRWALPLAIQFAPKIVDFVKEQLPKKSDALRLLRRGVARLRKRIKK